MSQTGPWSVKGIDQRAREAAREAAMAEGITLGEYLNRLLMSAEESHYDDMRSSFDGPSYGNPSYRNPPRPPRNEYRAEPRPQQDAASALERLSRRIEATEARSTLAITGIDHTVLGLVARIQNAEQTSAAVAGHVEGLIDEMRETHEALQAKVRRMEQDETGKQNLEALKALESALGKLANHIYEEAELTQNEALAIKGRVESGFSEVTERVEGIDTRVQRSLSETAARIDRAVEQAEQRAEGVTRHLSERMGKLEGEVRQQTSQLEAQLNGRVDDLEQQTAARLSDAQKADERLNAVEDDVTGALSSMEATLLRVQERLNRAETTTDAALKGLESTFASLDERIDAVAKTVDPELADRLRKEFDARFEDITQLVRSTVDNARTELAGEITRAVEHDAETQTQLRTEIGELKARLAEVEARDPEELTAGVREEIERLGSTVSERIDALAEHVETRLEESEHTSAEAIEQVGEQVTVAAVRLQKRQDEALSALAQEVEASRKTTDARLSDALAGVSERLEDIHNQAADSLSPMQRAIAALASRLESLEAFTVPPGAELPPPSLTPEAPTSFTEEEDNIDPYAEDNALPPVDAMGDDDDDAEFEAGVPEIALEDLIPAPEPAVAAEFSSGFGDWDQPTETETSSEGDEESAFGSDFEAIRAAVERLSSVSSENEQRASTVETDAGPAVSEDMFDDSFENDFEDEMEDGEFTAGVPGTSSADIRADYYDPLSELAGLEDARSETRESDIFDDEGDGHAFIAETQPDMANEDDASLIDTLDNASTDRDAETSDYIARARRAALAAADTQTKSRRVAISPLKQKNRGGNRAPLLIAASAAVLTGAAAGGYLYLRGKQPHEPSLSGPVDTYVDPIFASAPPAEDEAAPLAGSNSLDDFAMAPAEDELFDSAAGAIEEDIFGASADNDVAVLTAPAIPAPRTVPTESPTLASLNPQPVASYPRIPAVVTVESEANAGNAIAQYQLAQSYLAQNDLDAAIPLLRRAALKGAAPAQYDLGKLYEQGAGVDRDLIQARSLIGKAAEAGHVGAMYDLALFMAEGEGGELDAQGATDWFRKAADHGFLDAQYNLGVMFAEGIGAEQDLSEALYWFELASRQGDAGASLEVRNLSGRLPSETVRDVIEAADAWSETPSIALANGRFGAQRWNTGNPLQVQAVQTALSRLGYLSGQPDGVLGPQTANAIRDYQRGEGLSVTGTVTPELIERLNTGTSRGRG